MAFSTSSDSASQVEPQSCTITTVFVLLYNAKKSARNNFDRCWYGTFTFKFPVAPTANLQPVNQLISISWSLPACNRVNRHLESETANNIGERERVFITSRNKYRIRLNIFTYIQSCWSNNVAWHLSPSPVPALAGMARKPLSATTVGVSSRDPS